MGDIILNLPPMTVGAAAAPVYLIVVLFLLQSEGGLRKTLALVAGGLTVRLVQGILFGYVLGAEARDANAEDGSGPVVARCCSSASYYRSRRSNNGETRRIPLHHRRSG